MYNEITFRPEQFPCWRPQMPNVKRNYDLYAYNWIKTEVKNISWVLF